MSVASAAPVSCFDFHGITIECRYQPSIGEALTSLFEGFDRCPANQSGMFVELSATSESRPPAPAAEWQATFCHGLVQGYSRGGEHRLSDGQSMIEVSPHAARMTGVRSAHSNADVFAGMLHIGLGLLLRERGIFDLHAATACNGRRALVLLGDSGAGKTTLLLALMAARCGFLGDDRLLFRSLTDEAELLAYPREFHLSDRTLGLLSADFVKPDLGPAADGKHSLKPLAHWPKQFRRSWRGPISLLFPRIEPRAATTLRQTSSAEAFGRLLSSSASVAVEAIERRAEQLQALRTLAIGSNAFDLLLGADLLTEPEKTAERLLDSLEAHGRDR